MESEWIIVMLRRWLQFLLLASLWLVLAQNAVANPKGPQPPGILLGNVALHPGAQLDIGYNSNKGHGDGTRTNDVLGDGYINVGATFRTELTNFDDYSWQSNFNFFWQQFFGAGKARTEGGAIVRAATSADIFKTRILRITPQFSYAFVDQPEDENLRQDFRNHFVSLGSGFLIQPGEGKIFSQKIAYNLNSFIYPSRSEYSYLDHRFELLTKWYFLPVSSLTLLLEQRVIHYLNSSDSESEPRSLGAPFRVKLGLQGLLLSRLSYTLGLGYSYAYYKDALSEHMFIMQADLGYSFTDSIKLSVGYKKDHENSNTGTYYKFHRIKLGFDGFFIDHLTTSLAFTTSIVQFSTEQRQDLLFGFSANLFYHFFAGLKLGVDYRMRINKSDADLGSYMQHVVGLSLVYEY